MRGGCRERALLRAQLGQIFCANSELHGDGVCRWCGKSFNSPLIASIGLSLRKDCGRNSSHSSDGVLAGGHQGRPGLHRPRVRAPLPLLLLDSRPRRRPQPDLPNRQHPHAPSPRPPGAPRLPRAAMGVPNGRESLGDHLHEPSHGSLQPPGSHSAPDRRPEPPPRGNSTCRRTPRARLSTKPPHWTLVPSPQNCCSRQQTPPGV